MQSDPASVGIAAPPYLEPVRPVNRTAPRLVTLVLAISFLLPATAAGAEPALGGAITLADGTVLPPMPADLLAPSAQAEMLAEQGGPAVAVRYALDRGVLE